ncbi:hypothetical protein ACLOJK_002117 [Asimina triloba]
MRILRVEDILRRIVKLWSHEHSQEREEAVSLLWELSKSESLCEKIGGINGAILILDGMTSSKSDNVLAVEKAEKLWRTLGNMVEIGRLQPLLALLLAGSPETKLTMASHLGDLVMSSDVKVFVARMVGPSLIDVRRSGNMHAREAALKALNQISSSDILSKNHFSGVIPKEIFSLQMLELLDLRENNLSGKIPAEMGNMLSLKHLLLCDNKFQGSLPTDFGKRYMLTDEQFTQGCIADVETGIDCINRTVGLASGRAA